MLISQLPVPLTKALEKIMGNLDSLLGEYGEEMRGIAKACGMRTRSRIFVYIHFSMNPLSTIYVVHHLTPHYASRRPC